MFLLSTDLLSKKSRQQFATGLTAAVLLSGISAITASAQPATRADESRPTELAALESTASGFISDAAMGSDILVYPHDVDGRQAATLYVKDIPVLTFLGTDVDSLANGTANGTRSAAPQAADSQATDSQAADSQAAAAETDEAVATVATKVSSEEILENNPVLRATEIGSQLNPETIEATDISVRWQEESEGFIVTLAEADLIALDSRTILADTTEDAAEDALQVTNRLRRLIGDADPVSEIEGMPEPEPEPVVETPPVQQVAVLSSTVGSASWYGPGFNGRQTANGEIFNQYAMTAAHRTLPFGTRVLVTNLYTGRQVVVRINDRGPYAGNRVIDLSKGAAAEIGLIHSGVGTVQIDVLSY